MLLFLLLFFWLVVLEHTILDSSSCSFPFLTEKSLLNVKNSKIFLKKELKIGCVFFLLRSQLFTALASGGISYFNCVVYSTPNQKLQNN